MDIWRFLNPVTADRSNLFCVRYPSLALALLACAAAANAQSAPPTAASASVVAAPTATGLQWVSLGKSEQSALAPLAKTWDTLSDGQKRKWLAIAKTFPDLGKPEQEKLHARMEQWALLSPKEREVARLNFGQSKTVNTTDRAANWEAYQALSAEERQKLAEGAKVKPVGAAVAVKPVPADKMAAVPVTRHTPEPERSAAASQRPLNRNTLLPQPASGSAPTTAEISAKP